MLLNPFMMGSKITFSIATTNDTIKIIGITSLYGSTKIPIKVTNANIELIILNAKHNLDSMVKPYIPEPS